MLEALGIDEPAGIVYHAVLAQPGAELSGLPSRTGLAQEQVRAALESLTSLDLVRIRGDSPGRLEAVNPLDGLAAIVRRQEEELAGRQQQLAVAKATATAYAALYSTAAHVERLADLESIRAQVRCVTRNTAEELQVLIPARTVPADSPPLPSDWQAEDFLNGSSVVAGVQLLVLYHAGMRGEPVAMAQAAQLAASGAQVRIAPDLPPILMISDKRVALIPVDPAQPGDGAICIREPAIAALLAGMFRTAWAVAKPLNAAALADLGVITADERALLKLLAAGLTDEAAARRLGQSVRTTRRQVAALMDKLGASSRFQAGHKAAERGWL